MLRIPPRRLGGVPLRAGGWFARVYLLPAFRHDANAVFGMPIAGDDDLRAAPDDTRAVEPALAGASAVTLGVQGRNLLDDDIRTPIALDKDAILLPGRNGPAF